MEKTGDICKANGYYRCNVHHECLVSVDSGQKFPECTHGSYGNHKTLWNPARNLKSIMAELKAEAMQVV
jgi:hypothetical protein